MTLEVLLATAALAFGMLLSRRDEEYPEAASYPDVSLDVRAKEGGKETAVCTLPMVPCGSSPVTRFALASAMRKTKRLRRRLTLSDAPLLPEMFHWNNIRNRTHVP